MSQAAVATSAKSRGRKKRISDSELKQLAMEKLRQARRERGIPEDGNAGNYKRTLDGTPRALIDILYRGRTRDRLLDALEKRDAHS